MKTLPILFSLVLALSVNAAEYEIDPAHSVIGFSVKHLGISTVRGTFGEFSGSIDFDETKKQLNTASGSIKTKSIDTQNGKRDDHLRSEDFFDAKKFPEISFQLKSAKTAGSKITAIGDLTLHGVTKPVTLQGEYLGAAKDGYGNNKVGFTVTGKINRKDFGLNWNMAVETGGVVVSEEVGLNLEIQANKKQ